MTVEPRRPLTEEEWRVALGASSLRDYARAAAAAVGGYGYLDPDTQHAVRRFQRAADASRADGVWDDATACAAARAARVVAPAGYAFGAEYDVSAVQQALNRAGWQPPLVVDGVAGDKTHKSLSWFQKGHGLAGSGVIDAQTAAALGVKAGSGPARKTPIARVAAPPVPGIHQSVVDSFLNFNRPLEGDTPFLYTDSKGYVTTGVGNLVEDLRTHQPAPIVFALPWKKPDGSLASRAEIAAAWQAVKSAWPRVQSRASQSLTNLRLSDSDVAKLVAGKMAENQSFLARVFPAIAGWPADAQMAVHALSWAWGPGFATMKWGGAGQSFIAAVNAEPPDFAGAVAHMQQASRGEESINPGLVPRDRAVALMLSNAADVLERGADVSSLLYPNPFELGMAALREVERVEAAIPFWVKATAFVGMTGAGAGLVWYLTRGQEEAAGRRFAT